MIKTYDSSQSAFTERDSIKIYDTTAAAWVDAPSVKTYDTTEAAWVERMKRYMELTVTSNYYNNSGNLTGFFGSTLHCEVKPTSSTIYVRASVEKKCTNPVISGLYSYGYSDECPAIGEGFLSHACVYWYVRGYYNGSQVAEKTIANGNQFAYKIAHNQPFELTLNGTFDTIELVCEFWSMSAYANYGRANTTLDDFAIDGKVYEGKGFFES